MRRQRAGVGHADGRALERLDFLRQWRRFGDAFGLRRVLVHRPIDEELIQPAHHHGQPFAFLVRQNDIVAGGKTKIDVAGDQRANIRPAAVGRVDFDIEFFIGKIIAFCAKKTGSIEWAMTGIVILIFLRD